MSRPRAWTPELLPRLRETLIELAGPDGDDGSPDEVLSGLAERFPAVGRGLVELMARDPSLRVSEQAALLLFFTARFAAPRLRNRVLAGSLETQLVDAMHDPSIPDERKYSMGPLLGTLGYPLPDAEYAACFHDFDGTVERLSRDGITSLLDMPEQVEALLGFHGLMAPGLVGPEPGGVPLTEAALIEALERGVETLLHNAQVGAVLVTVTAAICRERGLAVEAALQALELVARSKTPRAAWYLAELGRWPGGGDVGDRARTLSEETPRQSGRPQPVGAFSHGLVSALDGEGSRDIVLFYRTPEGTHDGLALLLNERLGIQDAFAGFGDGDMLETQARERFSSWAPCDIDFARALVADALAVHERTRRPVPGRFLLFRPYLGEAPILPAARKPELGAYALETLVPERSLVAGSEALAEHEVYGDLGSTSDAAYAFARSRARRTLEGFLREVVVPERSVLLARFAAALEIEARAGRARRPVTRLAAKVFLALETELLPVDEVPFVRAISKRALVAVEKNVKKGFRSQAEASAVLASS